MTRATGTNKPMLPKLYCSGGFTHARHPIFEGEPLCAMPTTEAKHTGELGPITCRGCRTIVDYINAHSKLRVYRHP